MELQIADHEIDGDTHVIDVDGQIDLYSAPEFKERTLGVIEQGKKRVVVDLSGVTFMDSTGLSVLVGALKRLRLLDGRLTIVAPDDDIRRIFEVTGLDRSFTLCRDREDALEALAGARCR
jgi:anti-sigma B factor antagonist